MRRVHFRQFSSFTRRTHGTASRDPAGQLVRLQRTEVLCRKSLKFVQVAPLHAKTIQNRPLATIDRGLIEIHRLGHFGFGAFLPKQLFDQPEERRSRHPRIRLVATGSVGFDSSLVSHIVT